jgi:hypothetical protein
MKNIVILQPGGVGDILFCLKIAYAFYIKYNIRPVWPISKNILWLKDYIITPCKFVQIEGSEYEQFLFQGIQSIIEKDDNLLIPLWVADQTISDVPILQAKYKLTKVDYRDWAKFITIKRNFDKELELFHKMTKELPDAKNYTIANKLYKTPPHSTETPYMTHIEADIETKIISDYTVFDWLLLYEKAKEIHTVSTSLFFMLEAHPGPLPTINIYNRALPTDLNQLLFLKQTLNKNWSFHGI